MSNADDLKFLAVLAALTMLVAFVFLPLLRPILGWVLRIAFAYAAKWLVWLLRTGLRLTRTAIKHLLLPYSHFYPSIAPEETGSVRKRVRSFHFGGRGDNWAVLAVLTVLIMQWTPIRSHIYLHDSVQSETSLIIMAAAEWIIIFAALSWLLYWCISIP